MEENPVPIFDKRTASLDAAYKDGEQLPVSLSNDILAFTPSILHKVLEVDKQKALYNVDGKSSTPEEELAIAATVWPTCLEAECSLMLADVSGFCKISEELCSRGVQGLDKLRTSINNCFSTLITIIRKYGGDILNFAGDALIIAWFDLCPTSAVREFVAGRGNNVEMGDICGILLDSMLTGVPVSSDLVKEITLRKKLNAMACINCGLELASSEPLFDTKRLKLHVGVASGPITLYVVGGKNMEFQFLGASPLYKELGKTVDSASSQELVICSETQQLIGASYDLEKIVHESSSTLYRVGTPDKTTIQWSVDELERLESSAASVADHRIVSDKSATYKGLMFIPPPPQLDLVSPTPNISVEDEIREVTVVFVKLDGPRISKLLTSLDDDQQLVEDIVGVAQQAMSDYGAMMRQFLVDDKGMVMIFTLGVPKCVHVDDPIRGVKFAADCCNGMAKMDVLAFAGVTTGKAYIGSIGNRARKEYALVGDSVNLAARLMSYGYKQYLKRQEDKKEQDAEVAPEEDEGNSPTETEKSYSFANKRIKVDSSTAVWEATKFSIICDEHTMYSSKSVFDYIVHANIKIKGKSDMSVYEVDPRTMNAGEGKCESWLSDNMCIGFDAELGYMSSVLKMNDVKRKVSFLSTQLENRNSSRAALQRKLLAQRPNYQSKTSTRAATSAEGATTKHDPLGRSKSALVIATNRSPSVSEDEEESDAESHSISSDGPIPTITLRKRCSRPELRRRTSFMAEPLSSSRKQSSRLSVFAKTGGTIVLVKGDEGAGKTTFLGQSCKMATAGGLCPVFLRLKPAEHFQPYSALSHILQVLFNDSEIRRIVSCEEGFFEKSMQEWEGRLTEEEKKALPEIKNSVLKVQGWSIAGWTEMSALRSSTSESHDVIQQVLLKLFTSPTFLVLLNEKLIIAVDDIHFMDSCSWDVLIRVVATPSIGLLMVCTANIITKGKKSKSRFESFGSLNATVKSREVNVRKQMLKDEVGEIQTITLGRLKPADISLVIRGTFPDAKWSEENLRAIFEYSVGHPFVAIELARTMRSNGGTPSLRISRADSGGYQADAIVKAFTARVDNLNNAEQRALKAASVIGDEFSYETLIEIVPRSFLRQNENKTTQLDTILKTLVNLEFLYLVKRCTDESGKNTSLYEFCHSKLRTTCYGLLLPADQTRYHKQVAAWIATKYQDDLRKLYVPLMYHLIRGNDYDKAMDYAIGSIKSSVKSGAFSECRVIVTEALSYVKKGKLKPRTMRMMSNTLKHVFNQHKQFQKEQSNSLTSMKMDSSPMSSKRWSLKSHLPTTSMLLFDNQQTSTSTIDTSEGDVDSSDSGMHSPTCKESSTTTGNFLFGFRSTKHRTTKKEPLDAFWMFFKEAIEKIDEKIEPKVDDNSAPQETNNKNGAKAAKTGKKNTSKACVIQ